MALGIGADNQKIGNIPLPLDLRVIDPTLSGCFLRTSTDILIMGSVGSTGALPFALPIPNVAAASGAKAYAQAVLRSTALKTSMSTNAYAIVIGR